MEGATEHGAVVQALIDDLIERGLDPAVPRLFIIDGSKALAKAIRRSFGRQVPIQRCQIHKARNIMERLPKPLHAAVRRALRQVWELDDADKAEKLIRNLAQRLEREAPGVSKSILEGLDEILTVTRLGLPDELRRSLACTNIIENVMGTIRRVSPKREALAVSVNGFALDRCGHAGSEEGFSQVEGIQAASCLAGRACCSLREAIKQLGSCPKREGSVTLLTAAPASPISTQTGTSPVWTFALHSGKTNRFRNNHPCHSFLVAWKNAQ